MEKDAIQDKGQEVIAANQDVSIVKGEDKIQPSIDVDHIVDNNRLKFMEEIAKRNRAAEKDDYVGFDGDDIVVEEKPTEQGGEEKTGKEPTGGGDTAAKDEDELINVKVDGIEQKIPLSKIKEAGVRTFQKESAADRRLEEATRLMREIQAERELYAQQKQQKKEPEQKQGGEEKPDLPVLREYLSTKTELLSHAQAYGTPEEFRAALKEYNDAAQRLFIAEADERISSSRNNVDVSEYVQREFERREMEALARNNEVIIQKLSVDVESGGFKDLLDNPKYARIYEIEVDDALKSGKPNTFETYAEAGNSVRKMLGLSRPEPEVKTTSAKIDTAKLDERRKRKQAEIDNITISSARAPGSEPEDRPKTMQEIRAAAIEQLRKSRGQK